MKFKLDENLSPTLAAQFVSAGHEAHSALQQALGGAADASLIETCQREGRALVTLDLDFANIQRYPPGHYPGLMVMRLGSHAHGVIADALARALEVLEREVLVGRLWIIEVGRIRIHE